MIIEEYNDLKAKFRYMKSRFIVKKSDDTLQKLRKWCNRKVSNGEYLKLGESCLKSMEVVYKGMNRVNSKTAENMNTSRAEKIRNSIKEIDERMANPFNGEEP